MMQGTIANFKESLSQIALDVQDAAEQLEIYRSPPPENDRRISHRFAQSKSPISSRSSIPNGTGSPFKHEIEQYKTEIQRLQASETEIKALSVNYAAILKDKEEELSRLHEENGSLRRSLATNAVGRNESLKIPTNNLCTFKGPGDQSTSRNQRNATQTNSHVAGNLGHKGYVTKLDATTNGSIQATQSDGIQRQMDHKLPSFGGRDKEVTDLLEEHNRVLATVRANYETELKQLRRQTDKDRDELADTKLKLHGEQKLNDSSQQELLTLKMDKDRISAEMKEVCNELNQKISEIKRLQSELNRRDLEEEADKPAESLKNVILTLEKENHTLQKEKDELAAALKRHASHEINAADSDASNRHTSNINEAHSSVNLTGEKDMLPSILKLEKALKDACQERDKALQELVRLKQHLLEKELEESDKMDEDSKIIENLRAECERQRVRISHLEKALNQARSSQEEIRKVNSDELQKSKEVINDLEKRLESCMKTVDSKNVELLNFQTALGQYYAEAEAKERLGRDLVVAREESAKLSELLKDANQRLQISDQEKGEILAKLSQAETKLSDGKQAVRKVEEDNSKLRRALEQSMTRLNRMSLDSDYFVDRRIVIKLLVTYFQRNHSKEVLHLMVRMLGFSEEDKQRIGLAQQGAGKGVVRGVLGLPGRLVGGFLGGSSAEVSAQVPSETQSFADLWVDFLLKETEERERRENAGAGEQSKAAGEGSPSNARMPSIPDQRTSTPVSASTSQTFHLNMNQIGSSHSMRANEQFEQSDSEFLTVPLASPHPAKSSQFPGVPPRY